MFTYNKPCFMSDSLNGGERSSKPVSVKAKTVSGRSSKVVYSDEEVRRWREMGKRMPNKQVYSALVAEGSTVNYNYLKRVLCGDIRPFA
jgi:hypothetical protein